MTRLRGVVGGRPRVSLFWCKEVLATLLSEKSKEISDDISDVPEDEYPVSLEGGMRKDVGCKRPDPASKNFKSISLMSNRCAIEKPWNIQDANEGSISGRLLQNKCHCC